MLHSEHNQRLLLRLLFHAAAETLLQFGRNNLGGQVGFTLVLHTWDQQLRPHFHVHAVIAAGALSHEGDRWIAAGRQFLFPVRALSKVFRAKFLEALQHLVDTGQLTCDVPNARQWFRSLRKKPWIVYSKRRFAGPEKLLDYLGRYTHRVAISNHRLLSIDHGEVSFHWRDRSDGDRRKVASLPAATFIRRFLYHVLPKGFMRIRHYGFLANRAKKQALASCRQQLHAPQPAEESPKQSVAEMLLLLTGVDITRCPRCGAPLLQEEFRPHEEPSRHALVPYLDSS
jgi:hypothetical protein